MMMLELDRIRREAGTAKNTRWPRLAARRAMYDNNWADLLQREIRRQFQDEIYSRLRVTADTSVNLFRWATEQIARVYSKGVQRSVEGVPLPPMPQLDQSLGLANRWTFALGETLIRPVVDSTTGDVSAWVIPPDLWTVITDPDDPSVVRMLYLEFRTGAKVTKREVWTDEHYIQLDASWNPIKWDDDGSFLNPYGVIPYVMTHAEFPASSPYSDARAKALVEATLQLGVSLSDWNYARHTQSFKQLVVRTSATNLNAMKSTISDPASVIGLHGNGDSASLLDFQTNLSGLLDAILRKAEVTLQTYGFSTSIIRNIADASSGYALKLKMHGLEQEWAQQQSLWQLYEKQFWQKAALMYPDTVPAGTYTITFPDLAPDESTETKRKHALELYASGLWSAAHAMRYLGMSEDEIESNQEELLNAAATQPITLGLPSVGGV